MKPEHLEIASRMQEIAREARKEGLMTIQYFSSIHLYNPETEEAICIGGGEECKYIVDWGGGGTWTEMLAERRRIGKIFSASLVKFQLEEYKDDK